MLIIVLLLATAAQAETPTAQPAIQIEKVVLTPESPGPDTLCQLWIHLRNDGERSASLLGFEVLLNGEQLPTYGKDLFVATLPPGETTELQLFNFWTTETGRAAPADGRWRLEVRLTEAQWAVFGLDDGEPTWRSLGPVADLPQSRVVTWGGEEPQAVDSGGGDG